VCYYYFAFQKKDGDIKFLETKKIKQKVEVGLECWVLNPIYGTEEKVSVKIEHLEDDCIVCFAEKVDVVVMPCRHLCVGIECAKLIRENPKSRVCPICRTSNKLWVNNRNHQIRQDQRTLILILFLV